MVDKASTDDKDDLVALDSVGDAVGPSVTGLSTGPGVGVTLEPSTGPGEGASVEVAASQASGEMVTTPSSVVETEGCSLAARILTYGVAPVEPKKR